MDIKQIRSDFDSGVLLSRCTVGDLIEFAEHAVAVIAGRQQAIGALNMRVAELEQRGVNVPRVPSNPAAHDWAAPDLIDLQDLISRLRASIAGKESFEEATVFVANIVAAIDLLEAGAVTPVVRQQALQALVDEAQGRGEYEAAVMDDKSLRAKTMLERVAAMPTPDAYDESGTQAPPVAQDQDAARMDWLEEAAENGCVTMCFEIDGGVHVTLDPVGGEQIGYRNVDSIRAGIDSAMQAEVKK